jgi:predicted nucleotidyltransferase
MKLLLADYCRSRHVRRLALFGSTLRGPAASAALVN